MAEERLYRDDAGAAVERAARLDAENAQLRAEIERMRSAALSPKPKTSPKAPFVLFVVVPVLVLIAGAFAGMIGFRRPAPQRIVLPIPSIVEVPIEPAPPPTVLLPTEPVQRAAPVRPDCSPPYFVTQDGIKHYKAACLYP